MTPKNFVVNSLANKQMSKLPKFKSMRLVRLGDLLFDEHRRLILLCRNCQSPFLHQDAFEKHLPKCAGLEHIVTPIDELKYDDSKREIRQFKSRQDKVSIYEIDAVRSVNAEDNLTDIDWEAELDDPRWYSDEEAAAKTRPTHSNTKENVVKMNQRNKVVKSAPQKRSAIMGTISNRSILISQQQQRKARVCLNQTAAGSNTKKQVYVVPNVMIDLKRMDAFAKDVKPTAATFAAPVAAAATAMIPPAAVAPKNTQEILNRLRACGVQVKRSCSREAITEVPDETLRKQQQALDIMRKLQSKGIQCRKVNNAKKPKLDIF